MLSKVCKDSARYKIDPKNVRAVPSAAEAVRYSAIEGKVKEPHTIDIDKCIKCGCLPAKMPIRRNLQRLRRENQHGTIKSKLNGIEDNCPGGHLPSWRRQPCLISGSRPSVILKEINEIGACRICVVEVKGRQNTGGILCISGQRRHGGVDQLPRCWIPARKTLQLLLSNHERKCLSCVRAVTVSFSKLAGKNWA